jgi:hypothetical protein
VNVPLILSKDVRPGMASLDSQGDIIFVVSTTKEKNDSIRVTFLILWNPERGDDPLELRSYTCHRLHAFFNNDPSNKELIL